MPETKYTIQGIVGVCAGASITWERAMEFSRAEGIITDVYDKPNGVHLIVYLESRHTVEIVRDARVNGEWETRTRDALVWLVDQLTQETISNELALEGWEPIGTTARQDAGNAHDPLPRSPAYVLRRPG